MKKIRNKTAQYWFFDSSGITVCTKTVQKEYDRALTSLGENIA